MSAGISLSNETTSKPSSVATCPTDFILANNSNGLIYELKLDFYFRELAMAKHAMFVRIVVIQGVTQITVSSFLALAS